MVSYVVKQLILGCESNLKWPFIDKLSAFVLIDMIDMLVHNWV